mgnify:CR=1 FL=1
MRVAGAFSSFPPGCFTLHCGSLNPCDELLFQSKIHPIGVVGGFMLFRRAPQKVEELKIVIVGI